MTPKKVISTSTDSHVIEAKVKSSDEFRLIYSRPLPRKDRSFRAPVAVVEIESGSRTIKLSVTFGIDDPHLLRVLRLLVFGQSAPRLKGATLSLQFFGSDHSYQDLFGAMLTREPPSQLTVPIYSRIGVQIGEEVSYGKCLFASARAQIIAYGGPHVFDCHSDWRAWWDGIYTTCGADRCNDCGTVGLDGKWYHSEVFGWRLCFCND